MVEPDIPQMTVEYGACALQAGELRLQTHPECVIPIAFSRQHWLRESATVLRDT